MKNIAVISILGLFLASCAPAVTTTEQVPSGNISPSTTDQTSELDSNVDILANLPAVDCEAGSTPSNQEGPYFKEGSPETTNLFADGTQGTRLILAGQVLNEDCLPIPGVKLDFWQTDAKGEYDNTGYSFRGHQFTDNKGRYYLETVLPGLYDSRPIEHIHVKVTSPSGEVLTTQLYFPDQPVDGLTIQLEDRGDYQLGIFNFVVQN
jgi:protocatechuate 3,4-dioxygenase beta subunit